jgi:hypothetical protein
MAEHNRIPSLEIADIYIFLFILCNRQIFSAEQRWNQTVYSSVNQLHILLLQLVSHVFIFNPLCFMMDEEQKSILKPTDT